MRTNNEAVTDINACFRFKAGFVFHRLGKKSKYDHCQIAGVTLVLLVTFEGINKYLSPIENGPL